CRDGRTWAGAVAGSGDDAADHLAGLHRAEGVVHAVELDGLRHHGRDVEAAGLDQLDEAREVAPHLRRAVLAALERLLTVEDVERRQRELRVVARHADDDDLTTAASEVVRRDDRLREADHFEGVVDAAAARQGLHLLDGIPGGRIDDVGRAELLRHLSLERLRVDRDDAAGAGDARSLDDRLADTAATENGDGRAGADARRVERGSDAGRDAAADERQLRVGKIGLDPYDRRLVDRHHARERAEPGHAEVRVAVGARAAHLHADLVLRLAELGLLAEAVPACAARGHERRDDAVALLHAGHLGADLDDAASTLVTEHHTGRNGNVATHDR